MRTLETVGPSEIRLTEPDLIPANELADVTTAVWALKGASYRLRDRGIDTLPSIKAEQDSTH